MIFSLSIFITVLVNTLLAVAIGIRNPRGSVNRVFVAHVLSIIGWAVTLYLYYIVSDHSAVLLLGRLNFLVATYISFFFFWLAYIFPREVSIFPKWFLRGITGITILISLLSYATPFIDQDELVNGLDRSTVYGPLYALWVILICSHMLLGIYVIIRKLQHLEHIEKQQLRYLLCGFLVTFVLAIGMNIVLPYGFNYYGLQPFGPLSTIIFVAASGYAIGKYRLFDLRFLTAKAVTYVLALSLFGLFYAGSLFVIGTWFIPLTEPRVLLLTATVLTLFFGMTFHPLEQRFGKFTARIFSKGMYSTDEFMYALSQIMASTIDISLLINKVLAAIRSWMSVSKATIIVLDKTVNFIIESNPGMTSHLGLIDEELIILKESNGFLILDDLADGRQKEVMRKRDIVVFLPLKTTMRPVGYLLLGPKSSGEIYFDHDIRAIQILAPALAVALENAQSYDEIKRFNITLQEEVKKATEKLSVANEHLKELDKLKDEFLSIASHDLRTPMTAMKGYLWLMLKKIKELPPDMAEKLRRIYNSSERMIGLVNDTLDVSRIESGRMEIVEEVFDICSIARDVFAELQGQAEDRQIQLTMDDKQSHIVAADRNKTHEVLVNFVGNAIKFTPEKGSVSLSFHEKKDLLETSVVDTGIGIAKKDMDTLFKKFGRIDTSDTKVSQVSGTGLGLFICKKIIELSGGTIVVKSTPGKGSTFVFTLPLAVHKKA